MPMNTLLVGPQNSVDGSVISQRGDNYGDLVTQRFGPSSMEITRRGYSYVYTQPAAGVNLFTPTITSVITTGAFVVGRRYQIANVGDTDFTLIGAASNTVGVEFVATGVGGGTTGTANLMNSTAMVWNKTSSGVNFIPTKLTLGLIGSTAIVLSALGLWMLAAGDTSTGVITIPTASNVVSGVNALIGGGKASSVTFSPTGQLLTVAPTFAKTIGTSFLANDLTGKNTIVVEYKFTGRTVVKPGVAAFFGPIGAMAALAIVSLEGWEIPVQSGAI